MNKEKKRIQELEKLLTKCESCFTGFRWDPDYLLPDIQRALYGVEPSKHQGPRA